MASDYRSFYVEQTPLLFLLHFCGRQFREHRIQKLRRKETTFKLLSIELLQNMVTEFFRARHSFRLIVALYEKRLNKKTLCRRSKSHNF